MNLRVSLFDGSYHSVDSSEMAFKIAASMALKKGFMEANPVLLEPIQNVYITVPESFMGDVMGDLNKNGAKSWVWNLTTENSSFVHRFLK